MAITIDAPRWAVWAWLVQMGFGRGGWYSIDRLDNAGVPSAEKIARELQHLHVGDRLPSRADDKAWFDVVVVQHERVLVLRAPLTVPVAGRSIRAPVGLAGSATAPGRSCSSATSRCGLGCIVRTRAVARPELPLELASLVFWDPAHLIMERRQLINLRRRAEATTSSSVAVGPDAVAAQS